MASRPSAPAVPLLLVTALACCAVGLACSGGEGTSDAEPGDGGTSASSSTSSGGATSSASSSTSSASSSASSSSSGSADDAGPTDGGDAGSTPAPGLLTIGRFDTTDPNMPSVAWPGARIVARFDGTSASVKLTHLAGSEAATQGSTFVNVLVDGVRQPPREVSGVGQVLDLTPGGVAAGVHTVEIEKRTEANIGTLRLEGFTFTGGAGLLPPPNRPARRIEYVSESTIDGFGVDGNGADDPATCNNDAPSRYDDARKSLAFYTADALSAEHHLVAFSGKGVARNNDGTTTETMSSLWTRTLPESPASTWAFASWTPDVVVVSLGGADYVNGVAAAPANFQTAYANLVADIRTRYGASPYVFLLVWSQLKDYDGVRTAVRTAIDAVVAGRPANERTYRFQLPEAAEAVETGCFYHANDAHHQAMAALLVSEIKAKTGW